tara:strand:- start:252 stop:365 length:114 start_codon:yes stop_codon:yes gene_type:complete
MFCSDKTSITFIPNSDWDFFPAEKQNDYFSVLEIVIF